MSEHKPEPSDVTGDHAETVAGQGAADIRVESPSLAPEPGEGARVPPKREAPRLGAPGRITIMAPSRDEAPREQPRERSWEDFVNAEPKPEVTPRSGNGRVLAIAAMIALAVTTGAVGGSMATSGLGKLFAADDGKPAHALEDHVARLETELSTLRAEVERNARQSSAARTKTAERLEKLEKSQAEPAAKLARLSDAVEKLRSAPPPAPAPVVAATPAPAPAPVAAVPAKDPPKEVTGSITPPPAPAPVPAAKPEVARLPTVDGWRILDIARGGATIEGRPGIFEVYAGDPVPGLGRVDAIRKQDGHWTVVTSRGLIIAR